MSKCSDVDGVRSYEGNHRLMDVGGKKLDAKCVMC